MSQQSASLRYKAIEVNHDANLAPVLLNTEGELFTGYSKITGIGVSNFGDHTDFNVGINNANDNVEVDLMDHSRYTATSEFGSFLPVEIHLDGFTLINIKTKIRKQVNSTINYQVVVRLEK